MQTEIHQSCTAVPHDSVDTPQIASYGCRTALHCDITCTVQKEKSISAVTFYESGIKY
jgi:hypothetical protein